MSPLFDDVLEPFGTVRETTLRVVTWNVWSNFGPWPQRSEQVRSELAVREPDIIALQEVWKTDEHDVVGDLAAALGFHVAEAVEWYEPLAVSGTGVLSRWPVLSNEYLGPFPPSAAPARFIQATQIDGPRGASTSSRSCSRVLDRSEVRQRQVCELATYVKEHAGRDRLTVVCGDFNASPPSRKRSAC